LSTLARDIGLHVATARRILQVLVQEGLILQDPFSKLYYPGLELFSLGMRARQFTIIEKYRTALERIAHETGDTVFLLIRSGHDAMCIDRVEGTFPIKALTVDVGARRPLGIGPGSLSLIAFLPEAQFEEILKANERRYPYYRNLTSNDIRRLAEKARRIGYVATESVFYEGAISLGVPIYNRGNEVVAAITVSSIPQRMRPKRRREIAQIIKRISSEYC